MTASPSQVPVPSLAGGPSLAAGPTPRDGGPRRRDQIRDTAAELFATKGYTRTSMRDVAAASGILAGSLYHHFESKEAIAVELVENYHADLVDTVRKFGSVDVDAVTALRLFTREVAEVSFRHQAALQIRMFDAPSTASSSLRTVIHADPASLNRRWRTLIGAAVSAGAISPDVDPRLLRHVLYRVTMQAGSLAWWQGIRGTRDVADCITTIVFDGLTSTAPDYDDKSAATRVVNEATERWAAETGERRTQRPGAILETARDQFALRGFEATTMRDIADATGITAGNLYRYFESKDSMILEILGYFSDRLLEAFKQVIGTGSTVVETLDAIMWLLEQASRQFGPEIEILQGYARLVALGLSDHYEQGAQARLALLAQLIGTGAADGELNQVADPELVATCVREIMWSPMRDLAPVSPIRARNFFRHTVLSGAAAAGGPGQSDAARR
jgi:AcrR family transcriptional regulator